MFRQWNLVCWTKAVGNHDYVTPLVCTITNACIDTQLLTFWAVKPCLMGASNVFLIIGAE